MISLTQTSYARCAFSSAVMAASCASDRSVRHGSPSRVPYQARRGALTSARVSTVDMLHISQLGNARCRADRILAHAGSGGSDDSCPHVRASPKPWRAQWLARRHRPSEQTCADSSLPSSLLCSQRASSSLRSCSVYILGSAPMVLRRRRVDVLPCWVASRLTESSQRRQELEQHP